MNNKPWHLEAVPRFVIETIKNLGKQEALEGFYLAGGTALALYFGHRISKDLGFFKESFEVEKILAQLQLHHTFSVTSQDKETLHLVLGGIKVSLLGYPYPVLFPLAYFQTISVADPRDIACMKLSAVAGRGSKRDFIDLYVLANEFGLAGLLDLFKSKFSRINYNILHILKSLTYFDDADKEPMPNLLAEISWEEVKAFFVKAARGLI